MVHLRFTSFVLVGLLFVMLVLIESSASAHKQGVKAGYFAAKENNVAVPKGVLDPDGVNAAGLGKIWHGGRKLMAVQKVLLNEDQIDQREDHGRLNGRTTSEINSGEGSKASDHSPGLSQDKLNAQNNMNMLRPKSSKSASLGIPRSTIKPDEQYYRDFKAVSNKAASLGSSSRTSYKTVSDHQEIYDTNSLQIRDETQRLLEATKEIVNMMRKDYGKMARRKPPTNNNDPWRH